jgi:hypothetical protein
MPNHISRSFEMPRYVRFIRAVVLLLCFGGLAFGIAGFLTAGTAQAQNKYTIRQKAPKDDAGEVKVFDVNAEYGTLAFRGKIERTDTGSQYLFRVQLAVVFFPGETLNGYTMTNRTKVADLKSCELVATQKVADNQPYKMLQRETRSIDIRLTEFGEMGVLPDMEFALSKSIVAGADHVGLAVIGGGLAWPVPMELK